MNTNYIILKTATCSKEKSLRVNTGLLFLLRLKATILQPSADILKRISIFRVFLSLTEILLMMMQTKLLLCQPGVPGSHGN